jgi:hypothetical protein
MDYELAVQGIEKFGFNNARAVSVVVGLKEGPGACCQGCWHLVKIGLNGSFFFFATSSLLTASSSSPPNPIEGYAKCQHLWCKQFARCFAPSC